MTNSTWANHELTAVLVKFCGKSTRFWSDLSCMCLHNDDDISLVKHRNRATWELGGRCLYPQRLQWCSVVEQVWCRCLLSAQGAQSYQICRLWSTKGKPNQTHKQTKNKVTTELLKQTFYAAAFISQKNNIVSSWVVWWTETWNKSAHISHQLFTNFVCERIGPWGLTLALVLQLLASFKIINHYVLCEV